MKRRIPNLLSFRIFPAITLLIALSCGTIFMNLEGTYYYATWGTSPDATGCMDYDTNADKVADASMKTLLELAANVMTLTRTLYSDTGCGTLDATIVATTDYTIGNAISSNIIKKDLTTGKYSLWTAEPVIAVELDLSYKKATLTCKSATCVATFTATITAGNCSTGTLSVNTAYDYTNCQFAGQPKPLYSIAYKNGFEELTFGTSQALSVDSVSSYDGSTTAKRYKYILANEKFLTLK